MQKMKLNPIVPETSYQNRQTLRGPLAGSLSLLHLRSSGSRSNLSNLVMVNSEAPAEDAAEGSARCGLVVRVRWRKDALLAKTSSSSSSGENRNVTLRNKGRRRRKKCRRWRRDHGDLAHAMQRARTFTLIHSLNKFKQSPVFRSFTMRCLSCPQRNVWNCPFGEKFAALLDRDELSLSH